jgi:cytochrome b subunit of formate dehydrogenase
MQIQAWPFRFRSIWRQVARWVTTGLFGALVLLMAAPGAFAADQLDNANCQTCHDGNKALPQIQGPGDSLRDLNPVAPDAYTQSVHARMQCVACHTDITDNASPHAKNPAVAKPNCVTCHTALWESVKQKNVQETGRLGLVVKNIEAYQKSFHAKPHKDDASRAMATCEQCHSSHSFAIPLAGTPERAKWRLDVPNVCGTCHTDALKQFKRSIHGQAIFKDKNPESAICTDCHTSHTIGDTTDVPVKLALTEKCGNCHEDRKKTYIATYHGQISTLGYANTAKCYDCHGAHNIFKASNPKSKVHPSNLIKTCRQCHNAEIPGMYDAPPGFISFQPHGRPDLKLFPEIWIANQIMIQLLLGTFGFFWLHTLLWFYREYKDRQQGKLLPRVKLDAISDIPSGLQGKHFQRFSLTWRIAHLTFALSLMILTLTGIPLFYPEAPWAKPLMHLLGGPENAGIIHRTNAVVFAGVFFWHLGYMAVTIGRNWKNFKVFGPNSLIPGLQDLKDIVAMFKWFFGKAPRPIFDRWTYWEKFDYWAPFWGVTIIGVSGLLMWWPNLTGQYLPGWVFNVAAIFHSEEAFLAVVFLFTVHFFNNHFRPDKFPLDRVMFTGTVTLEELRHEHPLQYKRLLDSGELEKHLVDPPSSVMHKGSTILGFALIVIGLTLLTLVGIGFFASL